MRFFHPSLITCAVIPNRYPHSRSSCGGSLQVSTRFLLLASTLCEVASSQTFSSKIRRSLFRSSKLLHIEWIEHRPKEYVRSHDFFFSEVRTSSSRGGNPLLWEIYFNFKWIEFFLRVPARLPYTS